MTTFFATIFARKEGSLGRFEKRTIRVESQAENITHDDAIAEAGEHFLEVRNVEEIQKALTTRQILAEYKLTRDGDEWGTCMAWLFAIASEMYFNRNFGVPDEWQYSPGCASGPDVDQYEARICAIASDEALQQFGNALHLHCDRLKERGLDY